MSALVEPFSRVARPPGRTGGAIRTVRNHEIIHGPRPTAARQRVVVEFIVPVLLGDSADVPPVADRLAAYLDENVRCVSPSLATTSRTELVSALVDGDDVITHTPVETSDVALAGSTCHVEWELRGRFTHPAFVRDDRMIEPSGRVVTTTGAMVLRFAGERVGDIRCYWDTGALGGQLLRHGEPAPAGRRTQGGDSASNWSSMPA